MKKKKMTAIMILALCLMVLAGSVAEGGVHLEIDGQDVETITLKQSQQCSITVVSDDNAPYELNVRLLSLLGSFTHDRTEAIAGDLATVTKYGSKSFDVTAAGSGIEAGVHFVFSYEPNTPGITRLDLVDRSQMIPVIIDSIDITILPYSGPMGTAWTYQGRLMDANYPADGLYDFEFKLYNCSDPCWGVQLGDTVDVNGLDVIDGHFIVELDFGSDVFDGNAVWLETSVVRSPLGSAPAALRPLIEITPVPYALQTRGMFVDSTGNVGIGTESSSTDQLYVVNDNNDVGGMAVAIHGEAKGVVGAGANIGIYGVAMDAIGYNVGTWGRALGSGMINVGLRGEASNGTENYGVYGSANGGTTNWAGYFAGDIYVGGNAGIGTESPVAKLDVEGDGTNTPLELDAKGMPDYGRVIRATNTGMADGTNLNMNIGKSDNPGQTSEIAYYHAGDADPNNMLSLGLWGVGKILNVKYDGNVGIGTTNPVEKLHIGNPSGHLGLRISSDDASYQYMNFGATNGYSIGRASDDKLFINRDEPIGTAVSRILTVQPDGNVGIGTANPTEKVEVLGNVRTTGNLKVSGGYYDSSSDSGTSGQVLSSTGSGTNWINPPSGSDSDWGFTGSNNLYLIPSGNVGIGTTSPTEKLTVRGNILIESSDGTDILELGEGLDYAEGFDVSAAEKIEAGSVLVIDADNPGKLALSNRSYDTKVAGIVAGAKGLGSGVRLGAGQFDYDVALAGRVYCKVDATEKAVQAGDLLTTSTTPGYAMKAVDYARRHGTILGKAMESIEKGQKGQILVLVTLQ